MGRRLLGPVVFGVVVVVLAACVGSESELEWEDSAEASNAEVNAAESATATENPTTTGSGDGDPPIELAGTSWNVTDYSQGAGVITNVWKTEVTMSFTSDQIGGSSGCNTFMASFSVSGGYDLFESGQRDANDGQAMEIGPVGVTKMLCGDEDIMIQEGEILDLLSRVGRWVLIDGALNLRSDDDGFLLKAVPSG